MRIAELLVPSATPAKKQGFHGELNNLPVKDIEKYIKKLDKENKPYKRILHLVDDEYGRDAMVWAQRYIAKVLSEKTPTFEDVNFPDTPKKVKALKHVFNGHIKAKDAVNTLMPYLENDELNRELEQKALDDPEQCVRRYIIQYIRQHYPSLFTQLASEADYNASDEDYDKMINDSGIFSVHGHDELDIK